MSKQKFYCVNCGNAMERDTTHWPYKPTCGRDCLEDFDYKNTLSLMKLPYKPKDFMDTYIVKDIMEEIKQLDGKLTIGNLSDRLKFRQDELNIAKAVQKLYDLGYFTITLDWKIKLRDNNGNNEKQHKT